MKKILIGLLFMAFLPSKAQITETAIGGSVMYNFQSSSAGLGLRGYLALGDFVAIVPKFNYYLPFFAVHEYYLGVDAQLKFNPFDPWHVYVLGNASYHRWMNYENYMPPLAQLNSFVFEGGAGLMKSYGCVRPFVEGNYDIKWKEVNARIGLLFFFQDCGGGGKSVCPAYTRL